MAYNHVKEKVKSFLQPFAQNGQAVSAEDIKAYFEKLRGDDEAIKAAGGAALANGNGKDTDGRREQSGWWLPPASRPATADSVFRILMYITDSEHIPPSHMRLHIQKLEYME